MRAGRLDRRITLAQSLFTEGATGQRELNRSTTAVVWANMRFAGGKEQEKSNSAFPTTKVVFTIRYRTDVGPDDFVTHKTKEYLIDAVQEVTGHNRERFMELHCYLRGLQDG